MECGIHMFIKIMFLFYKQKTAYEMRISDWSSDVCSSDLNRAFSPGPEQLAQYRAMIAEYERAQAAGLGSIMVGGEHIDKAHVETARAILAAAAHTETGK